MSMRQLRARLDRLERSAKRDTGSIGRRTYGFKVDPALASLLRDDRKRLDELERKRGTDTVEAEEQRVLRERIVERAKTISCPANYGFNEVWEDIARLSLLRGEYRSVNLIGYRHVTLDKAVDVDAEEAQSIARIEAFHQTPEGRARARIEFLYRIEKPSAEELSERDQLEKLYPEVWINPKMDSVAKALAQFRKPPPVRND